MFEYVKNFFYASTSVSVGLSPLLNEQADANEVQQINVDLNRNRLTVKIGNEAGQEISDLNNLNLNANANNLITKIFPQTFVGNSVSNYKNNKLSMEEAIRAEEIQNTLFVDGNKAQAVIRHTYSIVNADTDDKVPAITLSYKLNAMTNNDNFELIDDGKSSISIKSLNPNMSEAEALKILREFAQDEQSFQQNHNLEKKIAIHDVAQKATYIAGNLGVYNEFLGGVSGYFGENLSFDNEAVSNTSILLHVTSSIVNGWATGNYTKPLVNTALYATNKTGVFGNETADCFVGAMTSGLTSSMLFSPWVGLVNGGLSAAKCTTDYLAKNVHGSAKLLSYGLDAANITNTYAHGNALIKITEALKAFYLAKDNFADEAVYLSLFSSNAEYKGFCGLDKNTSQNNFFDYLESSESTSYLQDANTYVKSWFYGDGQDL